MKKQKICEFLTIWRNFVKFQSYILKGKVENDQYSAEEKENPMFYT